MHTMSILQTAHKLAQQHGHLIELHVLTYTLQLKTPMQTFVHIFTKQ